MFIREMSAVRIWSVLKYGNVWHIAQPPQSENFIRNSADHGNQVVGPVGDMACRNRKKACAVYRSSLDGP